MRLQLLHNLILDQALCQWNYQWGAEKRNSILWFDDNFIGTELDPELSFAKVANACGLKGVSCKTMEETTKAIKQSCEDQKKELLPL